MKQRRFLLWQVVLCGASYKTYSNIRPEFEQVIIDGKKHFLNEETAKEFLKNPDESIRKQAYEKLNVEYKKLANVYASTLEGTMKKDVFYSKVRKFKSPLEASTFGDEVSEDLSNLPNFELVGAIENAEGVIQANATQTITATANNKRSAKRLTIEKKVVSPLSDSDNIDFTFTIIHQS